MLFKTPVGPPSPPVTMSETYKKPSFLDRSGTANRTEHEDLKGSNARIRNAREAMALTQRPTLTGARNDQEAMAPTQRPSRKGPRKKLGPKFTPFCLECRRLGLARTVDKCRNRNHKITEGVSRHRPKHANSGIRIGEASNPGPKTPSVYGAKNPICYERCKKACSSSHHHRIAKLPSAQQPKTPAASAGKRVATKGKVTYQYTLCVVPSCDVKEHYHPAPQQNVTTEKVDLTLGSVEKMVGNMPENTPAMDVHDVGTESKYDSNSDDESDISTTDSIALEAECVAQPQKPTEKPTQEEAATNDPINTTKVSVASVKSKVIVEKTTTIVKMHCHGPSVWTDYIPSWMRLEEPVTGPDAADREILNSNTYHAPLSWRGWFILILLAFSLTMLTMSDFRNAIIDGVTTMWRQLQPDTRSRYQRWRDDVVADVVKWLSNILLRLIRLYSPFSTLIDTANAWHEYYFAPPPPLQWGRYAAATLYTFTLTLIFRATTSAKRHVVYVAQGRFNATTELEINSHLLDLLDQDPDVQPRNGMSGNEVPASLISAVRFAILKYDLTNVPASIREGTMDCYLQRRMLRAAKSPRFRSHTNGLPNFRRSGRTG